MTAVQSDRRLEAGRARRGAILAAAARLFSERGYPATGINDIGDAAGVTGPAIYRHFATKEDLLVEVVMAVARPIGAGIAAARANSPDPRVQLREGARATLQAVVDHPLETGVYWREARHLPAGHQARLRRAEAGLRAEIVAALRDARPSLDAAQAKLLARMAINVVSGFALELPPSRLQRREIPLAVEAVVAVLLETPA